MATVRKMFDLAAAIVFTKYGEDTDFDYYSPLFLENLLVKALPYENQIRVQRGAAQIARAPEIGAIDETEIDWDDRITRDAIPHGLASMLMGDDNNKKAESVIEYNKFIEALAEAAPAIMEGGDDAEYD